MSVIENLKAKRDEIVAGGVAISAFAASAQHIFHVTAAAGNPDFVAALHPAGIDGLIYIGIRAMQKGRRAAGGLAVAYGAIYSLTFNAFSYAGDQYQMPIWMLAACMPLAMFFAFLIVHSGHKVTEIVKPVEVIVEKIVEVVKAPALLPIVPFVPEVAPVRVASRPKEVATSRGRVAKWDVEKVVGLVLAGQTNREIADLMELDYKVIQKTARCVEMLKSGVAVDECATRIPLSVAHVQRVHAAMMDAS